ncbi:hypothetical protein ACN26Y_05670 [Micromonospora sp. WMMD558]|uniref:hypothetical protein n=1 Tax=Micromonospora sp. WMMD558 TaxID=3403462 RepID=UPI003BF5F303
MIGAVVGAAAGLAMTVYWQDSWKSWLARRRRNRLASAIHDTQAADGAVSIGRYTTEVHLIEGDGQTVFEPDNIAVNFRQVRADLPPAIARARHRAIRQLAREKSNTQGGVANWNSTSLVALSRYHTSRTAPWEDVTLRLEGLATDYATFMATALSLDSEFERPDASGNLARTTLRREYFPNQDSVASAIHRPIPALANGIGVTILAFTDDAKVILAQRRPTARARPGQRDLSIVEGIHSDHDSIGGGRLSILNTAIRGCWEELGVRASAEDFKFLAFGVDMRFYQWNFFGLANLGHTSEQIARLHSIHAKDRWEGKLQFVDADPGQVFERLRQDGTWDTALVTTYLAFCSKIGIGRTRRSAERLFGSAPSQ